MTGTTPTIIRIDSVDAFQRGLSRGLDTAEALRQGVEIYLDLFETSGIPRAEVQKHGEQAVVVTEAWSADLADEMRGVASGSKIPLWKIGALNARTEILSRSVGAKPGECSTVVNAAGNPVSAQTWDWHEELSAFWHLQQVSGTPRNFVGLTEHGILSKIGINDAGVGIMLNILGHTADRPDGVPVHLVGARVLAEASTLAEAVRILSTAPVSTSSAITVVSPEGAVIVELNPEGAAVLQPVDGVLVHTNHFVDPVLSKGEKLGLYDPDTQARYDVLVERVAANPLPAVARDLLPYLLSEPGDAAQLCCVPAPGAVFGDRWATLATVTLDAVARTMTVSAGSPKDVGTAATVQLMAVSA
ncbi:penicillin acyltransferase [Salinibacterium sp. UTAS2018]|uniref:C45 family autoproteolytic acyltransferase/hydolase n=1 Tax=Salinibacterium sp. UTAS2018 TaxID=2508880 RepID=UPI0010095EB3|nr:C45 family peptidase [Salinibacterium sp. UTAS2018]QAV70953.1 penicillin acyltransferase [Salinibacterium sp. UTAS2018]